MRDMGEGAGNSGEVGFEKKRGLGVAGGAFRSCIHVKSLHARKMTSNGLRDRERERERRIERERDMSTIILINREILCLIIIGKYCGM